VYWLFRWWILLPFRQAVWKICRMSASLICFYCSWYLDITIFYYSILLFLYTGINLYSLIILYFPVNIINISFQNLCLKLIETYNLIFVILILLSKNFWNKLKPSRIKKSNLNNCIMIKNKKRKKYIIIYHVKFE
jgi:hypothetical protein